MSLQISFKLLTDHFSGGNCGLWWSYTYSNQQILSSTEFKAHFFALQLKSHNHLYPKEIWAFKSFEVRLIIITFFYVAFFISGLHKALWFMELLLGQEKSLWFWSSSRHRAVVLLECLVTCVHSSNLGKLPSSLFCK